MSYRMRRLQEMMPDVEIIHRSFALVKTEEDFDKMFGSRAKAREEIMGHWEHANFNDDLHRFNISGMRQTDFPFPSSMNGLLAAKAAGFTGGQTAYWDVFDTLQNALFVENRNVEELSVIEDCIRKSGIDFEIWKTHFESQETKTAVEKDLRLAQDYQIYSIPYLVINGKHRVSGAQPLSRLTQAIRNAAESEA